MLRMVHILFVNLVGVVVVCTCADDTTSLCTDSETNPITGHDYNWIAETLVVENAAQIQIRSIWGSGPEDVWAVGHCDLPSHRVWRRNQNKWTDQRLSFPEFTFSPEGIYGFSAEDVWCVGGKKQGGVNESTSFIAHYDGVGWNHIVSPNTTPCRSVWGTSSTNLYVGCDSGRIAHFDGKNWVSYQMDTQRAAILSIVGTSPNHIYAGGISSDFTQPADSNFHHFYQFENGEWKTVQSHTYSYAEDITSLPFGPFLWVNSGGSVHSVGLGGVYRLELDSWERIADFTSLRSIGGSGPQNIFVGGFDHQVYHFDGTNWFRYDNFNDPYSFIWSIWANEGTVHLSSTNGFQTTMFYGTGVQQRKQ